MQESKRHFLKMLGALGITGAAPLSMNLLSMGSLAAQNVNVSNDEYKALVCIFMSGGNDNHNMIVPYDNASYQNYYSKRPSIAIAQNALLPIKLDNVASGQEFAFHPSMSELQSMLNNGQVSVIANVGPLIVPTTKIAIKNNSVPLPAKLFSHNDQQSTWQSAFPEGAKSGYGGRMADILKANNTHPIFTAVSTVGNSIFLAGRNTMQYPIGLDGIFPIDILEAPEILGSSSAPAILKALMRAKRTHVMEQDINVINTMAMDSNTIAKNALDINGSSAILALPDNLKDSYLAAQFRMISRLMEARQGLGVKREIFFVNLGGFDTHDDQINKQAKLLNELSKSIQYFYNNLQQLHLENNVVSFTASDFGRTLSSNGDGTDHGWGSHHLIISSAVNMQGQKMYGKWPSLDINGNDDNGLGRLIPTTSVEQYLATLATWMGISTNQLSDIFPNLHNFDNQDLGIFSSEIVKA
jgi:uncharacterized protein (DUF1501 family)